MCGVPNPALGRQWSSHGLGDTTPRKAREHRVGGRVEDALDHRLEPHLFVDREVEVAGEGELGPKVVVGLEVRLRVTSQALAEQLNGRVAQAAGRVVRLECVEEALEIVDRDHPAALEVLDRLLDASADLVEDVAVAVGQRAADLASRRREELEPAAGGQVRRRSTPCPLIERAHVRCGGQAFAGRPSNADANRLRRPLRCRAPVGWRRPAERAQVGRQVLVGAGDLVVPKLVVDERVDSPQLSDRACW